MACNVLGQAVTRGAARYFWPHEKKSSWAPDSQPLGRRKNVILFYIKLYILIIFLIIIPIFANSYLVGVSTENTLKLILTKLFVVKKYIYEGVWLLLYNILISRKCKHFSDWIESSHPVCTH